MTDNITPRTDAFHQAVLSGRRKPIQEWIDFSRTLERELADCRAELVREGKMRDQSVEDMLIYKRRAEEAESRLASHAEREGTALACGCKFSDAWRCAVDLKLSNVSCHCRCHQPAPSAASGLARDEITEQMIDAALLAGHKVLAETHKYWDRKVLRGMLQAAMQAVGRSRPAQGIVPCPFCGRADGKPHDHY